jgi:hypothetical protein
VYDIRDLFTQHSDLSIHTTQDQPRDAVNRVIDVEEEWLLKEIPNWATILSITHIILSKMTTLCD